MEKNLKVKVINNTNVINIPEEFLENTRQYQECIMMYECAIREVRTKFEVLNADFSVRYERSPIEFIQSRVKKMESIMDKLNRKGLPICLESLETINDIAGVRVICSFLDDIYKVAELFTSQDDITLIEIKDYIQYPKPNGYRSLHLLVEVPVFFSDRTKKMRVEVQIRTIAMDFWASLEHQLKYKKDLEDSREIVQELTECAKTIADTDLRMQQIRHKIEKRKDLLPVDLF